MMILMNSAMMPKPGAYHLAQISKVQFCAKLIEAHVAETLVSNVGYPQNIQIIKSMTGVVVPLARVSTKVRDGDEMLIMRLKYRVDGVKGATVNPDDFEYFIAKYTA